MTPRERLLATLRHEEHDRVPLDIFAFNGYSTPQALGLKGFRIFDEPYEVLEDPNRIEIEERIADICTYQYGISTGVNRYLATPSQRIHEELVHSDSHRLVYRHTIDTPEGPLSALLERREGSVDNIWTIEYPVKGFEDLKKLASIPFEIPENLERVSIDESESITSDGRSILTAYISSPFVCVGGTMSYEEFLYQCAVDPDAVIAYVDIALERELEIAKAVMENRSIDIVWIGGSEWLTPPMSSPELYERLACRPEKRLIETIHAYGGLAHVHSHGNVAPPILDKVIDRRADYFEPVEPPPDGNIEFAEAKSIADGRITLGGNIELALIEQGTREEVEAAALKALEGDRSSMVLAISAPTNMNRISQVMRDNIHTLIDVWERESAL